MTINLNYQIKNNNKNFKIKTTLNNNIYIHKLMIKIISNN